jgi:myosin heavy subunit
MHTFERSLLPRPKASNTLTPLAAIMKEMSDMTTKEEKLAGLSKLFDNDPEVVKLVTSALDTSKKEAEQRGLTLKQEKDEKPEAAETDKAKKDGGEPDEDDMDGMDEATAKAYKAMLPHIVKTIHALTKASNMEDAAAREAKAAKKEKKQKKLEERFKEVDEMKTKIDQIAAAVAELSGDVPRALQGGFRATQSDANLLDSGVVAALKQGQMPDPVGGFLHGMGLDQFNMKGGG